MPDSPLEGWEPPSTSKQAANHFVVGCSSAYALKVSQDTARWHHKSFYLGPRHSLHLQVMSPVEVLKPTVRFKILRFGKPVGIEKISPDVKLDADLECLSH